MYAEPDPDPAAQINADPCGAGYGSGSETLAGPKVDIRYVMDPAGVVDLE